MMKQQQRRSQLGVVLILVAILAYLSLPTSTTRHGSSSVIVAPVDSLDEVGPNDDLLPASAASSSAGAALPQAPPESCDAPIHFIPSLSQRTHSIGLASFPGSGNTWLRALIEQGSRVYTGSIYNDLALNKSLAGEGLADSRVIAVKTHYPCPNCWTYQRCPVCGSTYPVTAEMTGPIKSANAQVFLLRCPFDAMLAEFKRLKTGKHNGEVSKAEFLKVPFRGHFASNYDKPTWIEFISQRLTAYAKAAKHYLDRPTNATAVRDIAPLQINVHKSQTSLDNHPTELFVSRVGTLTKLVFYEKLLKDPQSELEKVFKFIDELYLSEGRSSILPEASPQVASRCAIFHTTQAAQASLQRAKKRFNPWTPTQVQLVCSALGKWWFERVWGKCSEGKLQWERS